MYWVLLDVIVPIRDRRKRHDERMSEALALALDGNILSCFD